MLPIFKSKGAQNTIYGALILVMSVGLVVTMAPGGRDGSKATLSTECVARVYGTCITPRAQKVYMRFARISQQGESMAGMGDQVRKAVVDGLVERELLVREAGRLGLSTTDEELQSWYARGLVHFSPPAESAGSQSASMLTPAPIVMQNFNNSKTKEFDPKTFKRFADAMMGSMDGFNEWQNRELLAAKVRDAVEAPVRISDEEAWDGYAREKSTATLSYVRVKDSFVAQHMVQITPAEVATYLKDHAAEVDAAAKKQEDDNAPKAERIRHILISVTPESSPEERGKAKRLLAEAWGRLKSGETFASVARSMSSDPGSGKKGGWYTTADLEQFVPEFKDAAKALKAGERTNGAVETQFGWHILERDDESKKDALLKQSRTDIAAALLRDKKAADVATKLATDIDAGWKAGTMPIDLVIKNALKPYAGKSGKPAAVAIKLRDAGADPKADDSKSKKKSTEEKYVDLTEDADRPELLSTTVYRASGSGLQGLAGVDESAVVSFAFAAKDGETFAAPLKAKEGRYVVRVKEHLAAKREDFDAGKDTFVQGLVAKKRAEALSLYVKDLREHAKADIRIDDKFIKSPAKKEGDAPPAGDSDE